MYIHTYQGRFSPSSTVTAFEDIHTYSRVRIVASLSSFCLLNRSSEWLYSNLIFFIQTTAYSFLAWLCSICVQVLLLHMPPIATSCLNGYHSISRHVPESVTASCIGNSVKYESKLGLRRPTLSWLWSGPLVFCFDIQEGSGSCQATYVLMSLSWLVWILWYCVASNHRLIIIHIFRVSQSANPVSILHQAPWKRNTPWQLK